MSSFIQTLKPSPRRRTRVLGLSEILPRISLIEDVVEGLRVLEYGVQDVGSLLHLDRARPERIAGTSPYVGELKHSRLAGRRVELIHMERGRLDFPSASFDVILVNDLLENVEANPDFMNEIRRVLAPDGFGVLAFDANGHSVAELVNPELERIRNAQPRKMVELVRQGFDQIQFLEQTPFVGVAILSEDADPSEVPVSLDASLAGAGSKASHILALCGPIPPIGEQRTLVELPFHALEEEASARFADANQEVHDLEKALERTRIDLETKEASLKTIGERLKPLREAVVAKMSASSPPNSGESSELQGQIEELQFEIQGERARRRALEEQLALIQQQTEPTQAPRSESDEVVRALQAHNDELANQLDQARLENSALQQAMANLKRNLELRQPPPMLNSQELLQLEIALVAKQNECEELQQRLASAERQLTARISSSVAPRIEDEEEEEKQQAAEVSLWQRLAELEQEHELQGRRLLEMEDSYRSVSSAFREHKESTDESKLERDRAEAGLRAKIAALVGALQVSEAEVHNLRGLLDTAYENQSTITSNSERAIDEVENRFALEREIAGQMKVELDTVRREVFETRTNLETVQRGLVAKTAEFDTLRTRHTGVQADKAALELVSAQLTQELQTLRDKYYSLKSERDTLMETSRALIDERDVAQTLVDGVGESERRVRELSESLEGGQAAIRRLEWELDARDAEIRELKAQKNSLQEASDTQQRAQDASEQKFLDLQDSAQTAREHVRDLERRITQMQQQLSFVETSESAAKDEVLQMERLVQDISYQAMETKRSLETYQVRADQLQIEVYESQEIINAIQAEHLRLEARLLDSETARQEAETQQSIERADKALLRHQLEQVRTSKVESTSQQARVDELVAEVQGLEVQLAGLLGAKEENELALGQTLKEAANLVATNQALTQENAALVEQLNQFAEAQLVLQRAEEIIFALETRNAELSETLQIRQALRGVASEPAIPTHSVLSEALEDATARNRILTMERDALRVETAFVKQKLEAEFELRAQAQMKLAEMQTTSHQAFDQTSAELKKSQAHTQRLEEMILKYEQNTLLLASQIEDFERRAVDYDAQFREAQIVAMDALEQLNAHESDSLDREAKIERYNNEKTAMILRIKSLEEETERSAGLEERLKELSEVQSELEQTREELSALTSSNKSLREAWESVSTELSEKVMAYEQGALDARDREHKLQEELRRLTESAMSTESQLRSEVESSTQNEQTAREIARDAQRKNEEGFQRIAVLEQQLQQAVNQLQAIKQSGGTAAETDHELQAKLQRASETIQQLKNHKAAAAASVDEIRADLGTKLQENRQLKEALSQARQEVSAQIDSQKRLSQALKQVREQNVSPENAHAREQMIAKYEARTKTLETENHRLRQMSQKSETALVDFELKISRLENTIMERNRQVELLRSEVADKAERLRRFSERLDKL